MHDLPVSGFVGSNHPFRSVGLTVCYLTQNLSHFHLACLSCIGSQNNYVVFNPDKETELHVLAKNFEFDSTNTRFCFDASTLKCVINSFDVIITTMGFWAPTMHNDIREICKIALSFKIPVIDVPHGLFQFAHNFWDDSQVISLISSKYGANNLVKSFCSAQISWFRDNPIGPGYPRSRLSKKFENLCVPDFTLITSNTNWFLYDDRWQRSFLRFVTKYAYDNPEELIIWSPHPAEVPNSPLIKNYIENLLPPNLFVYGKQYQLNFYGIECTEDLIANCKKGITTVSTCLIDYELHNKDTVVLSSNSTQNLIDSLKNVSSINLPDQLTSNIQFTKPETGYLFPYNVKMFDQLILSSVSS